MAFLVVRPERGQEADLKVDVVGHPPQPGRQSAAEYAQGQHQQDREGNGPALIQGRYAKEDHQHGKGIEERRLGRLPSAPGRKAPFQSKPIPWAASQTISSMACIASPELLPGAGSPQIFTEENPL